MLEVGGEKYLNASEAATWLRISRMTFYRLYRDNLQVYRVGALKRKYYKLSEIEAMNQPVPLELAG